MERLIKNIRKNYLEAKKEAARKCAAKGDLRLAQRILDCDIFTGEESFEGMVELIFSPQGIEFLTTFNFPDLATFRKFKKYHPERYGVYIDKGEISLIEPRRAFLIGNTTAKIIYRQTAGNRLNLMCGATADVTAEGYSLIRIEKDASSAVSVVTDPRAKILM